MTDVERATALMNKYFPDKPSFMIDQAISKAQEAANKHLRIVFRTFLKSDLSSVLRHCSGDYDLSLPATAALILAHRINQTKTK